jgi:putative spermidine/putrescine transport system substrate-binding protein
MKAHAYFVSGEFCIYIGRRHALYLLGAGAAATFGGLKPVSAQDARELVIVTYSGALSAPHRWLADRMEAQHPGLSIRLVPSDSQDIVAQIKAAQGYSPFDAGPNDEPPHLIGIGEGYLSRRAGGWRPTSCPSSGASTTAISTACRANRTLC